MQHSPVPRLWCNIRSRMVVRPRFPWNSMDSTAISMEYSDSISMEAMENYAMASIECHGRGGILQNSMEVMELDLVEN